MFGLRHLANDENPASFSNRMRTKRFHFFEYLVRELPRPLRVLDVGGTTEFWENRGWAGRDDVQITMLNLTDQPSKYTNIMSRIGDARHMPEYEDISFDVAFSNSVIEHLFTFENQMAMAQEICRVSTAYWIQTPNYWFPMEPHFHVPGWQWLPLWVRIATIQRRRCGWRGPCPDVNRAREAVSEIRLLTYHELRSIFPNGAVMAEKFFGLNKSWIVYGGFPSQRSAVNTVESGQTSS